MKRNYFQKFSEEFPLALGKAVSKKNRENLQTQLPSLVYGETEFRTLGNVFEKIKTAYGLPNQVQLSSNFCSWCVLANLQFTQSW